MQAMRGGDEAKAEHHPGGGLKGSPPSAGSEATSSASPEEGFPLIEDKGNDNGIRKRGVLSSLRKTRSNVKAGAA